MLDSKQQTKGKQVSKYLKVTSINSFGYEHEMDHPIPESIPEDMGVVAILKGVNMANSFIKSFEIVEV